MPTARDAAAGRGGSCLQRGRMFARGHAARPGKCFVGGSAAALAQVLRHPDGWSGSGERGGSDAGVSHPHGRVSHPEGHMGPGTCLCASRLPSDTEPVTARLSLHLVSHDPLHPHNCDRDDGLQITHPKENIKILPSFITEVTRLRGWGLMRVTTVGRVNSVWLSDGCDARLNGMRTSRHRSEGSIMWI